ncbi:hypothetical protein [Alsobacter metallidurans]|nr:hypothetical protein [Alsobacter metallidurans]
MRRGHHWMALAGGVSLVAVTAHVALDRAMVSEARQAVAAFAPNARIDADPWSGRITLRDLAWTSPSGVTLSVGRVSLSGAQALVSPAHAADTITLENVTVEGGGATYAMKRIDVTGANVSRDDVAAIFDKTAATPIAERLARITAEQIAIPEIAVAQKKLNMASAATYRDLRLVGVDKGVVKSFAASGGAFDTRGEKEGLKGTVGPMAGTNVDAPLIARIYTDKAGPNETEPRTAYGLFTIDAVSATADKGGGFDIGRITVKNFKARPTKEPMLAFMEEFAGKGDVAKLPGPERARFVNGIADILEAFSVELVEATDITAKAPPADRDKAAVKIARMSYSGAAMGRPNDMRLEGLDVTAARGYGRIGAISQTGWSFKSTLDALRATVGDPDNDLSAIDPRVFIPDLGAFAVRDVDLNVPDEKNKDPKAPNIRVGFKSFELATAAPLKGVPTALRVGLDRLTMAIPPNSPETGFRDLLSMGYRDLDLTFGLDSRWEENAAEFRIGQLALQGVNMGAVTLKGVMGNVTRDVFAGDPTAAQVALLGATVKQVGFTLENKGLVEKLLDREAKKQKKSVDQLRKELGGMAQVGIPAMLGGGANAKALGSAVARFLVKPGRLIISASARDPGGLGLADFAMAQSDPMSLLEQVTLTATAE